MKRLYILITLLLVGSGSFSNAFYADSTVRLQPDRVTAHLDSLRQQLDTTSNDTIKSAIYGQIASQYLDYDKLSAKSKRYYQSQALSYIYLALHLYSRLNDTAGLRNSFNGLAKVYRSQKKYPQAKWFILQSNSLSRVKKDTSNIMASLLVLANIKMEIKDYKLAKLDLDEALRMSKRTKSAKDESNIQQGYVLLYTHLKDYRKAALAAKRQDFIDDSLLKGEQLALAETRDSLLAKKKVQPNGKKTTKSNLTKKIASL